MKPVLGFALWLAPVLALAHPAPFAHPHGLLGYLDPAAVAITFLAIVIAAAWVVWRSRR